MVYLTFTSLSLESSCKMVVYKLCSNNNNDNSNNSSNNSKAAEDS